MFAQLIFPLRCTVVEYSTKFQKFSQLGDPSHLRSYGIAIPGGRISRKGELPPTKMHSPRQQFRQIVSTRTRKMRFLIQPELNKPNKWNQASRFECLSTYSEPPWYYPSDPAISDL